MAVPLDSKKLMAIEPQDYATASVLANIVSETMVARLEWMTLQPDIILEVGCGTGFAANLLRQRYQAATIFAADIQYPMLQFARAQVPTLQNFICADAGKLPVVSHSVDLLFANFVLPWCDAPDKVLAEWRRVLRPEGVLMFSMLGPDTLSAWRRELADITLPDFVDMHDTGDQLIRAKFSDPVMDVEYYTLQYPNREDFLRELQASSMLATKPVLHNADNKAWDAVYEVVYGHAFGPTIAVDQVADEEGTINIPLAQLRQSLRGRE